MPCLSSPFPVSPSPHHPPPLTPNRTLPSPPPADSRRCRRHAACGCRRGPPRLRARHASVLVRQAHPRAPREDGLVPVSHPRRGHIGAGAHTRRRRGCRRGCRRGVPWRRHWRPRHGWGSGQCPLGHRPLGHWRTQPRGRRRHCRHHHRRVARRRPRRFAGLPAVMASRVAACLQVPYVRISSDFKVRRTARCGGRPPRPDCRRHHHHHPDIPCLCRPALSGPLVVPRALNSPTLSSQLSTPLLPRLSLSLSLSPSLPLTLSLSFALVRLRFPSTNLLPLPTSGPQSRSFLTSRARNGRGFIRAALPAAPVKAPIAPSVPARCHGTPHSTRTLNAPNEKQRPHDASPSFFFVFFFFFFTSVLRHSRRQNGPLSAWTSARHFDSPTRPYLPRSSPRGRRPTQEHSLGSAGPVALPLEVWGRALGPLFHATASPRDP